MNCGNCEKSRKSGEKGAYCLLYGIYIHADHEGCRYHQKPGETEEKHEVHNAAG